MELWPSDGIDLSDEAESILGDASNEQLDICFETVKRAFEICLDVYLGRSVPGLPEDSWNIVENFLNGCGGRSLIFTTSRIEVELRRRQHWGLRVGSVVFVVPTLH